MKLNKPTKKKTPEEWTFTKLQNVFFAVENYFLTTTRDIENKIIYPSPDEEQNKLYVRALNKMHYNLMKLLMDDAKYCADNFNNVTKYYVLTDFLKKCKRLKELGMEESEMNFYDINKDYTLTEDGKVEPHFEKEHFEKEHLY